jgi:hypothetical protein
MIETAMGFFLRTGNCQRLFYNPSEALRRVLAAIPAAIYMAT